MEKLEEINFMVYLDMPEKEKKKIAYDVVLSF
jgi:hypothetical protein